MQAASSVGGFSARVERFLSRIQYRKMETHDELEALLRLRYDAYLREGAINERSDRRLPDPFDDVDNVVNVGLFLDGTLVSALRIHNLLDARDTSPALDAFPDLLRGPLLDGKRIVDCNRFVTSHAASRAYPELPYATVRLSVMAGAHYDSDISTATVRVEHQAFYKRSFFAQPLSEPRHYPTLTKPLLLMAVDFANDEKRIYERSSFYRSTEAERVALFGPRSACDRAAPLEKTLPATGHIVPQPASPRLLAEMVASAYT